MLYQQVIFFLLIGILLNLLLNLRALKRPDGDDDLPDPLPLISVLIPARNEEANIQTCVDSLRQQDYSNFEILVLDDASKDATAEIVTRIAGEDQRVRLLYGQPLPPGWAGKPYACYQLAREARGSWLLFTDADTVHAPPMLRRILNTALHTKAALISGFPYQRNVSIWHKMAMPIMFYFLLLCGMPFWWLRRSEHTMPAVAIGQFLFFSAGEYRSIGGHESVKTRLLDDVWLGREMARRQYRQLTLDLSSLVTCQMYREFGTMWDGITRWLYSIASVSAIALIVVMVVAVLLFLAPFLWLAHGLLLAQPAFGWQALVVLQVAILFLARYLAGRRFSQPTTSTILHPIGMSLLLLAGLYSSYQRWRGGGIDWKGRVYNARSRIS